MQIELETHSTTLSPLFLFGREKAAEAYLFLCKKLDEEPLTEATQEAGFKL